jgi:hypothetical protein
MKKIIITFFTLFIFVSAFSQKQVEASILVTKESLSAPGDITSFSHPALFSKYFKKNGSLMGYVLGFIEFSPTEFWLFSKTQASVTIDETVYDLHITNTNSHYEESNARFCTTMTINPMNIIDPIKTAQIVTFRMYFENQPYVDWAIPQNILEEWKTVINSDKDGNVNPEQ